MGKIPRGARVGAVAARFDSDAPARRVLQPGELLFRRGEPRTHLYLIEAGTIALYRRRPRRGGEVVEFTFAGDVVGLGVLPRHAFSAMALGPSRVRQLPLAARKQLLVRSERNSRRYAEAVAREFRARREELVAAFRGQPVRRLASLLLAMSELNRHEGRDPSLIADAFTCQGVADFLGLEIATLAEVLLSLAQMGFIAHCPPSGLRILDLAGLAAFSEEETCPAIL
jgi:CRP/FNR family transcriptional regulator, anaerobic regulatory protein